MLRILHNTHIDFISRWRVVTTVVALLLVPAVIWIFASTVRGGIGASFKLGIEFTGGTQVQYDFPTAPDIGQLRSAVTAAGFSGAEVQTFGAPNQIMVRAQPREGIDTVGTETVATALTATMHQTFPENRATQVRAEAISPRVGAELRRKAIIAMLISFGVTLLYLAWRFDARLSLAAVLANVHDIIATFAFIKYMQIELSLFVVGGILTVIGYSLNDKVVVFDRVRELLRQRSRRPLRETLNLAINQTLPRTILTGTTVIACLLSLIFLGGEVLRPFAWVLLFGIVIGTFSSIFIASPVLLLIERKWPRHEGETKGMSRALAEERRREQADPVASR
jgi:preprotein translocase subunit SecF